jgi:hypothetical protein
MPLQIVTPDTVETVEIDGTKVTFRPMNLIEKQKIVTELGGLDFKTMDPTHAIELIAPMVLKIDGHDGPIVETLKGIREPDHFWQIFNAVMDFNTVNEEEAKNSEPLPDGQPGQAGEAVRKDVLQG